MNNHEKRLALDTVIAFLKENEQYGDDWSFEIEALEEIIEMEELAGI